MDIRLIKETKEIKKIREHSIFINNIEGEGSPHGFLFRSVEENGIIKDLLFPFGKNKWSKKPKKDILDILCVKEEILFLILREFVSLEVGMDEIIVSIKLDDFRYIDGNEDIEEFDKDD